MEPLAAFSLLNPALAPILFFSSPHFFQAEEIPEKQEERTGFTRERSNLPCEFLVKDTLEIPLSFSPHILFLAP